MGLSPGPVGGLALRALGDPSAPAQGFIRWAGPLAGATAVAAEGVEKATGTNPGWNVDLNRGILRTEEKAREFMSGRKVTRTDHVQVEQRLAELALRETGKTINERDPAVAPYVRAMKDKTGPLWEQAESAVELERGIQAMAGFVSQGLRPQAIVSEEEAKIRKAKSGLLLESSDTRALDKAAETKPKEMADPEIVNRVVAAHESVLKMNGGNEPAKIREWLDNPTNENIHQVSRQIFAFQADNQPLVRGYIGSGSPEQRQIAIGSAALGNAGSGLSRDTVVSLANAQRQSPKDGRILGEVEAMTNIPHIEREAIKAADPLLLEYMEWRRTHPGMEAEDFLKEKWSK